MATQLLLLDLAAPSTPSPPTARRARPPGLGLPGLGLPGLGLRGSASAASRASAPASAVAGAAGWGTPVWPADWHLDEHTREVGRRGVAEARRALAAAAERSEDRRASSRTSAAA